MRTHPTVIPDLDGPVVVEQNLWSGKPRLFVGGVEVPSTGRRSFSVRTREGSSVDITVKSTLVRPFPTIQIGDRNFETGPALPVWLVILMLLPLALLVIGGALGGAIGALGVVVNTIIARSAWGVVAKSLTMFGVFAVALGLWFSLALAAMFL